MGRQISILLNLQKIEWWPNTRSRIPFCAYIDGGSVQHFGEFLCFLDSSRASPPFKELLAFSWWLWAFLAHCTLPLEKGAPLGPEPSALASYEFAGPEWGGCPAHFHPATTVRGRFQGWCSMPLSGQEEIKTTLRAVPSGCWRLILLLNKWINVAYLPI